MSTAVSAILAKQREYRGVFAFNLCTEEEEISKWSSLASQACSALDRLDKRHERTLDEVFTLKEEVAWLRKQLEASLPTDVADAIMDLQSNKE